jgi:4-diphosphocytidyl-2-C-methyl-D-erythritol kinase
MTTITLRARAKINLTLDVGARRPDGYHDIRSVMQTVALHDILTLTHTPSTPGVRLRVTGPEAAQVPADETNLVHKAAVRVQKVAAARGVFAGDRSGLDITLEKRIPSQAGLGGGSSDAAAALKAADALFGLELSARRLAEIGAALGADVPFFLIGGTALVEGLGERVTPLPALSPAWWLVLVKPPVGVPTAMAYAALDALTGRVPGAATAEWQAGGRGLGNDFEAVILPDYPAVAAAYHLLAETTGPDESFRPLLCGSGAALFRRAASEDDARRMAARVEAQALGETWVTEMKNR